MSTHIYTGNCVEWNGKDLHNIVNENIWLPTGTEYTQPNCDYCKDVATHIGMCNTCLEHFITCDICNEQYVCKTCNRDKKIDILL